VTTPEDVTSKRWTAQRKKDLVLESYRGLTTVAELCRREGLSQSTFYEWREQFLEAGLQGLQYGGKTCKEKDYKQRIAKLERKLGEVIMENEVLKKTEEIVQQRLKKQSE
jgi:transposase